MGKFALIGNPLSHSFSKRYFNSFFKDDLTHSYENLELVELDSLRAMIEQKEILGFNVTIPHKTEVLAHLDRLSPEAEKIGAVNCVVVDSTGWTGHNTDVFGFENSLNPLFDLRPKTAAILGTGGASMAVAFVLSKLGIKYQFVSRDVNKGIAFDELNKNLKSFDLIVNTTPLGTFPEVDSHPRIDYSQAHEEQVFYDLVYNPEKSKFLELAEAHGAKIKNGLEMLELQAQASYRLWGILE